MKKIICALLAICTLCFFSACATEEINDTAVNQNSVASPTEEIQTYVLPMSFTDRDTFLDSVISDHVLYNDTGEFSDYHLAEIQYYLDFITLPEGAQLSTITVDESSNYITLLYELSGSEISLTWYRADFGEGYNHFESNKIATSNLVQRKITLNEMAILEVYHKQNETTFFSHYSYHWEQEGDYIDLIVDAELVEEYGAEMFLSVGKVNVDFGDVSPAIIVTPTPSQITPTPVPDLEPTMAAPDAK